MNNVLKLIGYEQWCVKLIGYEQWCAKTNRLWTMMC